MCSVLPATPHTLFCWLREARPYADLAHEAFQNGTDRYPRKLDDLGADGQPHYSGGGPVAAGGGVMSEADWQAPWTETDGIQPPPGAPGLPDGLRGVA